MTGFSVAHQLTDPYVLYWYQVFLLLANWQTLTFCINFELKCQPTTISICTYSLHYKKRIVKRFFEFAPLLLYLFYSIYMQLPLFCVYCNIRFLFCQYPPAKFFLTAPSTSQVLFCRQNVFRVDIFLIVNSFSYTAFFIFFPTTTWTGIISSYFLSLQCISYVNRKIIGNPMFFKIDFIYYVWTVRGKI